MPLIAGVDGCRGGWIVIKMDTENNDIEHNLCVNFQEVINFTNDCVKVAVDMSIGLSNEYPRQVDMGARIFLPNGRKSCVFNAPIYSVVEPVNYANNADYNRINTNHRQQTNVGVPRPCFCIFNKLYEVNVQYFEQIIIRNNIKEFHPELVWSARTNEILVKKKTPFGRQQRINILRNNLNLNPNFNINDFISEIRNVWGCANIAQDDIIDAMGGLLAAEDMLMNNNCIVPNPVQVSANGLNMEIWY